MKKIIPILFLILCFNPRLHAQIAANWQVATWSQFKTAAVSYTLDDNCSKQLPVARPLFDQYNYKVTFFTVTNWGPNWPGLLSASNNGHEVASHTLSHPSSLAALSLANQDNELKQSQNIINTNIPNAKCITLAYPNCVRGDLTTTQKYYIAGRNCQGAVESSNPADLYNISSIITGNTGAVQKAADFNTKINAAKTSKGWCVFLTHGIDNDGGYSPTQSTELKAHLAFVNANQADFWVATFGNVVKYIKERKAASLVETIITNDSLQLTVSDNLDNALYNTPITVRRVVPAGWQNPKVYINGTIISPVLSTVSGVAYLTFDVVPDQGRVYLANGNKTVNQPPSVSITAPANNVSFTAPASINIIANAADNDGTISSVQFFNGTTLLGSDITAPYNFTWTGVTAGTYSISAKATDNAGTITTSSPVTITVAPPLNNSAPIVTITSPINNTTFTAPASVAIAATASDSDGTVSNVQFFNGTILLGTDATSPYSFAWTPVAAGTYSITTKATDNSGAVTTSAPISFTVNPAVNIPPTVNIATPANNATFTAPASVTITAIASDPDGAVSNVQFFNGTTLLGSDASSPYSFAWTPVAAGTYSITVTATDNSGAVAASAAVGIVVAAAPVGDIAGANCGIKNTSGLFQLAAVNKVNATSYNWWYTGSAQSITPLSTDRSQVTIAFGNNFSGGSLCVGVNYSVAPYFKQYCKTLTVCGAKIDIAMVTSVETTLEPLKIVPNPSSSDFTITAGETIQSVTIANSHGAIVYTVGFVETGDSISVGEKLSGGLYIVTIQYVSGRVESKKIQKML